PSTSSRGTASSVGSGSKEGSGAEATSTSSHVASRLAPWSRLSARAALASAMWLEQGRFTRARRRLEGRSCLQLTACADAPRFLYNGGEVTVASKVQTIQGLLKNPRRFEQVVRRIASVVKASFNQDVIVRPYITDAEVKE